MTSVSLQHLFLIPLGVQLTVLMLLGWSYRKRGYHSPQTLKTNIFRCTSCKHVYIDTRKVPLSKCPKCNTLNPVIRR